MQVLHVCSELFPLLKTGRLAYVVRVFPAAQIAEGDDVLVLLPAFPDLRKGIPDSRVVKEFGALSRHGVLLYGCFNSVSIYLIDIPDLYDRHGSHYHDQDQFAYMDNYLRFVVLSWVGVAAGLDPALAAKGRPAKSVFTVHNLAYQGLFLPRHLLELQLPDDFFQTYGLEFYGQLSYMKAGLFYADHVTTVRDGADGG